MIARCHIGTSPHPVSPLSAQPNAEKDANIQSYGISDMFSNVDELFE
jgi:hypothetical protein